MDDGLVQKLDCGLSCDFDPCAFNSAVCCKNYQTVIAYDVVLVASILLHFLQSSRLILEGKSATITANEINASRV